MARPPLKAAIADISAKRETAMSTKSEEAKAIPAASDPKPVPATLPKLTLYAHADVLKAIRRLAVEDGVQAQAILRQAMQGYLASRGHHFTDLTTGT